MKPYYPILVLLNMIEEPNRSRCIKMFEENEVLFSKSPGSSSKHQAWTGGYLDHLTEGMNIIVLLYNTLHSIRSLHFKLSDALLVFFVHDLEKPWKYSEENFEIETKEDRRKFRKLKMREYEIVLTPEMKTALRYIEGENEDYSPVERKMNELGAFCHIADIASARLWHDYPKSNNPWG